MSLAQTNARTAAPLTVRFVLLRLLGLALVAGVVLLGVHLWRAAELPEHTYTTSQRGAGLGALVVINTAADQVGRDECLQLLAYYRSKAEPGGQVSVQRRDPRTGQRTAWCVDNLDGKGPFFRDGPQ